VDARAVREGVPANDGLVGRNHHPEHVGNQAAGAVQLAGVHPRLQPKEVVARAQGHHHFFERRVPGPLADAVDGAFHLAAPLRTPARVLATASPRSSWQ